MIKHILNEIKRACSKTVIQDICKSDLYDDLLPKLVEAGVHEAYIDRLLSDCKTDVNIFQINEDGKTLLHILYHKKLSMDYIFERCYPSKNNISIPFYGYTGFTLKIHSTKFDPNCYDKLFNVEDRFGKTVLDYMYENRDYENRMFKVMYDNNFKTKYANEINNLLKYETIIFNKNEYKVLRNLCYVGMSLRNIKHTNASKLINIEIGDTCFETDPPQYNVLFQYEDGTNILSTDVFTKEKINQLITKKD